MIFIPNQDKKENLLIFDLKMRRIRYIHWRISQNFWKEIKILTQKGIVKGFNSKIYQ